MRINKDANDRTQIILACENLPNYNERFSYIKTKTSMLFLFIRAEFVFLEICQFWRAREWNYIADILHSCHIQKKALKSKSKT